MHLGPPLLADGNGMDLWGMRGDLGRKMDNGRWTFGFWLMNGKRYMEEIWGKGEKKIGKRRLLPIWFKEGQMNGREGGFPVAQNKLPLPFPSNLSSENLSINLSFLLLFLINSSFPPPKSVCANFRPKFF
jgi:hypothetical protein